MDIEDRASSLDNDQRVYFTKTFENRNELLEKTQEAVIQAYFLFEVAKSDLGIRISDIFCEQRENSEKLIKSEIEKRKFVMDKSDGYTFLKKILTGQKKQLNQDYVGVSRTFELTQGYPLETRIYIPIIRNANMEENLTVEKLIGPNSLNKAFSEDDISFLRGKGQQNTNKPKNKGNQNVRKKIGLNTQRKLIFVINHLIRVLGVSTQCLRGLGLLLNIPMEHLMTVWMEQSRLYLESKSIENIAPLEKPEPKSVLYKYCEDWCNICMVFLCNMHFSEEADQPENNNIKLFLTNYLTEYKFPKKLRNSIRPNEKIEWAKHLTCKTSKKGVNTSCYRNISLLDREKYLKADLKFRKFEREMIKHFIEYKSDMPCFLFLVLKFANSSKSCAEIGLYLERHKSRAKDNLLNHSEPLIEEAQTKQNKKKNSLLDPNEGPMYTPCFHSEGDCNQLCQCVQGRGFCEKFCSCKSYCKNIFNGCKCRPNECLTDSCKCFKNWRECDPEVCKSCACEVNSLVVRLKGIKLPHCLNTSLLYNIQNRVLLGKSTICPGLGLFAGTKFSKMDYIGEYVGETITFNEGELRDRIFRNIDAYYSFTLEAGRTIDSFSYGNKMRFINHAKGGLENCCVKNVFVQGQKRIAMYAKREINLGEEFFFNYGDGFQGVSWLSEFNNFVNKKEAQNKMKKKRVQKLLGKAKKDFQDSQQY